MTARRMHSVTITAPGQAELQAVAAADEPPASDEVAGPTQVTLISAGTELAGGFSGTRAGGTYPVRPGYAAVFRVETVGEQVTDLRPGDLAFTMGRHCSWQRKPRNRVVPIPEGLAAETAVFARMMGVSMSTLITTTARPGDRVLVTGLGPVGHLAAQIFASCGYRVTAVDPLEPRRRLLSAEVPSVRVLSAVPVAEAGFAGQVALVAECSGHEQAVLDGCRVVRRRGEVVLIGVPWSRRTDIPAFDLLDVVFHKYAVVRSGWEWEVPLEATDFATGSIFGNCATALAWLAEGRVRVDDLYMMMNPQDCQAAYSQLEQGTAEKLAIEFDWRQVADERRSP